MKYFNPTMNTHQARRRYYDLLIGDPVPDELKQEVRDEYTEMIAINIEQEAALAAAGWMTE